MTEASPRNRMPDKLYNIPAGARFSSRELGQVLSHYEIGRIQDVQPLVAGNRAAPKVVVTTNQGKFLLKRRPKGKDDVYRVAFAHAVQSHLVQKYFPVPAILKTCDDHSTMLNLNDNLYEFFKFVGGTRYSGSAEETIDSGRELARLHRYLKNFAFHWRPMRSSFHDSATVRGHLRTVGSEKTPGQIKQMQEISDVLTDIYNASAVRVNALGFDRWEQQVVHGDWHPGNMLFLDGKLAAVLDFDSAKIAPATTDLSNAMLQFSIVGDRPNPADWPDYLDQAKLIQVLDGYRKECELDDNRLESLLDLMIETMIAEAVLPVATTGFFGYLSGLDFLKMIRRKCEWIEANRSTLTAAIKP